MYKWSGIIIFAALVSCRQLDKTESSFPLEAKTKMMETDRAFSKMSAEKGMRKAFIEYMDNDGALLRPDQYPLLGADAIDYLSRINDSSFNLQWEPQKGYIAKSGDLGYTFGVYSLKPSEQDTILYGTYVSIWKKQADGSWKFVLDTGNEGIGAQEADSAK